MWLDSWDPAGILFEKYGYKIIYDSHSTLDARLSTVLINGTWSWKPARSYALEEIQGRLSEVNIGACDNPIWVSYVVSYEELLNHRGSIGSVGIQRGG